MSTTKTAIEYKEYGRLIGSRYSYFEITTAGVIHPPLFIDPMITARDLSALYVDSIANGNAGIRFYPGLTDDNRMVFIMCEVNAEDTSEETNYRIFDRQLYIGTGTSLPPVEPGTGAAENLHINYLSNVKVEGWTQPPIGGSDARIRKSRYYQWENIREFVEENIVGADMNNPATMGGHIIKIENAYVPDYLIDTFNARNPQTNPEYQRGYTAVFTLKDQFGVKLIDPDKSYDGSADKVYERLSLEIGAACPPICGKLNP